MINFAQKPKRNKSIFKRLSKTKKRVKKNRLKYCLYVLGVIIVLGVFFYFRYYPVLKNVYHDSLAGKDNLLAAQDYITKQDFSKATFFLEGAVGNFSSASEQLDSLFLLRKLPVLNLQFKALGNLLLAGQQTSLAILKVTRLASEVMAIVKENNEVSLAQITPQQKEKILKKIYESPPDLQGAKAEIDLAILALDQVPSFGLMGPVKQAAEPFREKLPQIQEMIHRLLPWAESFPQIVGYPQAGTYLFLLQNNAELRPTGGFIGTYGVLKLKSGEIAEFKTDNIYNLDSPVQETLDIKPPLPFQKYMNAPKWFMRDSNWSPDFPTAAQKAQWFYHQEGGEVSEFDGVVAVTPTFIESLLALTDAIEVWGINFNSENVVETLQYQVEVGFYRQGIPESERKEVIGDLSKKLLENILNLPQEKWDDLWQVFEKNTREKQILMYLNDEQLQKIIEQEDWAGQVKATSNDYLMVVDANMASLKTDPGVKRKIEYDLNLNEKNELIANLKITYENKGTFTWKTTRYRTYTRVYVPPGAELISFSGAMDNDRSPKPGEVETKEELGKTSFGCFIAVEPQETGVLSFEYKLPAELLDKIKNQGYYHLMVQKQGGAAAHDLLVNVDLGKKVKFYNPSMETKLDDREVKFTDQLSEDKDFVIDF